jgi:chromosome segregation ATPase
MISSCSTTYEVSKCADPCAKSLIISQLKSQIAQLEEDDKAYNCLLQKYRQLQNEYQLVNESKLHLEYELKQKNETTNKIVNELKCQNIDLSNELKDKTNIYQKLYADNANLFRNLEDRKKENENFCKAVADNENLINHISQDKAQCEHDAMVLNDTSKKNENDIKTLCNQLDNLKLKNKTQNDELNKTNCEMNNNQKCLNDVKCDNANLNNQINMKNSSLDTVQKQLAIANKTIVDLQNELSNLEREHNIGKPIRKY